MANNQSIRLSQILSEAAAATDANDAIRSRLTTFLRTIEPEQITEEDDPRLRQLLDFLSRRKDDESVIQTFYTAIERYPRNSLTPVHVYLVRQCCSSRAYSAAIPLLSRTIESFPKAHLLIYQDHLLYHFYGALCLAAMRQWSGAINFLAMVLASGGNNTSLIQLEAYRKFILFGLIHNGKTPTLPRTTHANTRKSLETLASNYISFAKAFESHDPRLSTLIAEAREEFARHGNGALLRSAVASLPSHKVSKLKQVYRSIPLTDLAERIELSDVETLQLLKTMVSENRIQASIDDEEGMVDFPLESFDANAQLAKLEQTWRTVGNLGSRMTLLQKQLELDPDYVSKQIRGNSVSQGDLRGKKKGKQSRPYPRTENSDSDS